MKIRCLLFVVSLFAILSCNRNGNDVDAFGNFEAVETTISSEISGRIVFLGINEGDNLDAGELVAQIDTTNLFLQKQKLIAQKTAVSSKFPSLVAQVEIYQEQINSLEKEKHRITQLLEDGAATQKQLDDVNGQINVINKQIENVKSQNVPIFAELEVIDASIELLNDQISRATILNPISGTVLNKFAEQHELIAPGRSLYKIANLNEITLRAYISETQLSEISIGDTVKIGFDNNRDMEYCEGVVYWISSKAEFTPKIIQTREERVNLVYAIKIRISNDAGKLKIGMPAEVYF
jgi:HlyD family secretion protein